MALSALYLADKSALARYRDPVVGDRLGPLLEDGAIATCAIVDLEILYSARSAVDYEEVLEERRALPEVDITPEVMHRAIEVQRMLAQSGRHRVLIPDLVIAATAEQAELTVLHYDRDFELIAEVTGQSHEWVAPRGSLAS